VFPVVEHGRAVYAQLRRLRPGPGQPRYLSVASSLAPNPGLAFYEPVADRGGPLVVTEGPTDALAAASAGYQAAAVFGVGAAGLNVARLLAAQSRPVVIAFDADDAGRAGSARLGALMAEAGAPAPMVLRVPAHAGDLAGWLASCSDWPRTFQAAVDLGWSGRAAGTAVALK
jgi:DNA primase